jgi:ABC-type transport system involved in multi-copper enzyme maturation permease subunit
VKVRFNSLMDFQVHQLLDQFHKRFSISIHRVESSKMCASRGGNVVQTSHKLFAGWESHQAKGLPWVENCGLLRRMKLLPVIMRELRAQARQPFTFWLRVLGVLAVLLAAWAFTADHGVEARLGPRLFARLHLIGNLAIWILVPLATADCISRERREGTLGLLFLTPLRPQHIVIAKGIAHGWRAATLLVAIVPVLTIPFLIGGIAWGQAVVAVVINASAIAWSLAAALLASSLARTATRAMVLAMAFAVLGMLIYLYAVGAVLGANMNSTWTTGYSQTAFDLLLGSAVVLMIGSDWSGLLRIITPAQIYFAVSFGAGLSVLALVSAVILAAERLRRSWREEPLSARLQRVQKVFCEPMVAVGWLQRWMRFKLERNPIGWLEQRQWSGRLVTWAWFAIIISVFSLMLTDRNFFRGTGELQYLIGWMVVGSMAVSAAGSFRRERETGVLELLLVSPLSVREIIGGRLRGLYGQFLPATAMFLGIWIYLESILPSHREPVAAWIWFFAVSFVVTPIVGLYFSVRCRYFLTALLLTLAVVILVPGVVGAGADSLTWLVTATDEPWRWNISNLAQHGVIELFVGIYLYHRLQRDLTRRAFPLERALA